MAATAILDTNVLIYAHDRSERDRQQIRGFLDSQTPMMYIK